ncbi:hypothetical protein [Tenacibaculum sp. Ill]|uniref:hypothetical protein n=1 Tax=Tenacibaculum sp. Ill TaxID=3445935 RepID=UPI003F78F3CE
MDLSTGPAKGLQACEIIAMINKSTFTSGECLARVIFLIIKFKISIIMIVDI